MADITIKRRRSGFDALWPWPGNIFLVVFASWLFYMGAIATLPDVKTALYGLGAVSTVVLVFGLRSAFLRSSRAGRRQLALEHGGGPKVRRSAIPDDAASDLGSDDGMSKRAKRRETEATELPPSVRRNEPAAVYPTSAPVTRIEPEGVLAVAGASKPGGRREGSTTPANVTDLEAWVTRDRAERGAQIVKLDQALTALTARVEAVERTPDREDPARGSSVIAALVGRIEALERATPAMGQPEQYLRIQAFNNAVNDRLIPRMQQLVTATLNERLAPEALRDALAVVSPPVPTDPARSGGPAFLEELQRSIVADREAIAAELNAVRQLAESVAAAAGRIAAVNSGEAVDAGAGGNAVQFIDFARRLDMIEGAAALRSAEAEAVAAEIRTNLQAVSDHMRRSEGEFRNLLSRLDDIAGVPEGSDAALASGEADVAALREALTTIIEQNREIRAQQEMLTARFDPPTRVEIDATGA